MQDEEEMEIQNLMLFRVKNNNISSSIYFFFNDQVPLVSIKFRTVPSSYSCSQVHNDRDSETEQLNKKKTDQGPVAKTQHLQWLAQTQFKVKLQHDKTAQTGHYAQYTATLQASV